MVFAYLQIGIVQALAGLFTYFYIMSDYGFGRWSLLGMSQEKGYLPLDTDVYSPEELPFRGNSCADRLNVAPGCEDRLEQTFDMLDIGASAIDLRLFFWQRPASEWSQCRWNDSSKVPDFWLYSNVSGNQICYTSEALFYAQCGYFVSIFVVQLANMIVNRTRFLHSGQQGYGNNVLTLVMVLVTLLVIFLCYFKWLNAALGTRMLAFPHFAVPAFPFFMMIIVYDEVRRFYIRSGLKHSMMDGRLYAEGWVALNSLS